VLQLYATLLIKKVPLFFNKFFRAVKMGLSALKKNQFFSLLFLSNIPFV
tara:strand:+ start:177 stop:323 length:147 start_codon:yes stop_codon:yes gene_type:complete